MCILSPNSTFQLSFSSQLWVEHLCTDLCISHRQGLLRSHSPRWFLHFSCSGFTLISYKGMVGRWLPPSLSCRNPPLTFSSYLELTGPETAASPQVLVHATSLSCCHDSAWRFEVWMLHLPSLLLCRSFSAALLLTVCFQDGSQLCSIISRRGWVLRHFSGSVEPYLHCIQTHLAQKCSAGSFSSNALILGSSNPQFCFPNCWRCLVCACSTVKGPSSWYWQLLSFLRRSRHHPLLHRFRYLPVLAWLQLFDSSQSSFLQNC